MHDTIHTAVFAARATLTSRHPPLLRPLSVPAVAPPALPHHAFDTLFFGCLWTRPRLQTTNTRQYTHTPPRPALGRAAVRVPQHPRGRGAVDVQPVRGVRRRHGRPRGHPGRDDAPAGVLRPVAVGAEAEPLHALQGGCGVAPAQSQRRVGFAGCGRGTDLVAGGFWGGTGFQ